MQKVEHPIRLHFLHLTTHFQIYPFARLNISFLHLSKYYFLGFFKNLSLYIFLSLYLGQCTRQTHYATLHRTTCPCCYPHPQGHDQLLPIPYPIHSQLTSAMLMPLLVLVGSSIQPIVIMSTTRVYTTYIIMFIELRSNFLLDKV